MLCPAGTYLSSDQICKDFSQTIQDTLTNSQLLNSAATQASSLISEGSAISMSASIGGKIFSQIKYLNISYSGELKVALLTWKTSFVSLGLTPDMLQSMIDKIPDRHVPYVFEKYDVPSSFVENFWENLGVIVFVTVIWLLLKSVEYMISPKKRPRMTSITRRIRVMVQNFLITALYRVYGDLVMFSIIEYRTLVFGRNLSLLSFITSILFLITMFSCFWYQAKLLLNYQKIKNQSALDNDSSKLPLQEFAKKNEGSQVLFKDFKDYSLAPQLFIFFLTARDLIFSLVLATMFDYPLTQTIIITLIDCLMIVYLFKKRPFQNTSDAMQQMFFEIISLTVIVSVLINAILDAGDYEATGMRSNIGKLIIVANMIFNFVTAFFMLVSIIQILLEFIRGIRERRAKKVRALQRKIRPFHETQNASEIDLKKNLDSNQTFPLSDQNHSLEVISPELNILSHQVQPQNRHSQIQTPLRILNGLVPPQRIRPKKKPNSHPRHHENIQLDTPSSPIRSPEMHSLKDSPLKSPQCLPRMDQRAEYPRPQTNSPPGQGIHRQSQLQMGPNWNEQAANSHIRQRSQNGNVFRQHFSSNNRLQFNSEKPFSLR